MAETETTPPDELFPMNPTWDPNLPTKNSFAARWSDVAGGAQAETPQAQAQRPAAPTPMGGLPQELGDLQYRQLGERKEAERGFLASTQENRARMQKAYDAEGIGPNDLQSFEKDQVEAKYRHSPVEAFGSLGAVFAMVASAFTRQPMTNGLNAAAGAMNAIKKGDDEAFKRDFEVWKANTDLTVKRHNIQHQQYTDSLSLADTDMRSAEAKFRMQAARFGDEKALLLLDKYGMSKELMDLVSARNHQITETAKASESIDKERFRSAVMQNDPDINSGDPQRMERAFEKYYGHEPTPEQQAVRQLYHDKAAKGEQVKPEDIAELHTKFQRLTSAGTTPAAQAARMANEAASDPNSPFFGKYDEAYLDANKRIAASKTTLTGNRRQQLESHVAQYDVATGLIGKVEDVLNKYVGAAGVAGKVTRMGERLSNIAGSFQTDRVQMMRNISELQLLAPRLLLDQSTGRPLSVEAGHINDIIAGLNAGDTTANTLRAMKEIKTQLQTIKKHNQEQLSSSNGGAAKKDTPAAAETEGGDWWTAAPLKAP